MESFAGEWRLILKVRKREFRILPLKRGWDKSILTYGIPNITVIDFTSRS